MRKYKKILDGLTYKHVRPYHGGIEIRVHNLDKARAEIQSSIKKHKLNIEIMEIDPVLKSISVK